MILSFVVLHDQAFHCIFASGRLFLKIYLRITCGTTWYAAGMVTVLKKSASETKMLQYAVNLFPALEQETDMSTGEMCNSAG